MKKCPICSSNCFDDMEYCYGCLHAFAGDADDAVKPVDCPGEPDIGLAGDGSPGPNDIPAVERALSEQSLPAASPGWREADGDAKTKRGVHRQEGGYSSDCSRGWGRPFVVVPLDDRLAVGMGQGDTSCGYRLEISLVPVSPTSSAPNLKP